MSGQHIAAVVLVLLCCRSLIFTILALLELLEKARPAPKASTHDLLSVVIPAFNEAAVLSRTLDSLLACDYVNKEIIVVDDGSCDGTRRVAEEYRDRFLRFLVLSHPQNRGKAAALNTGIAAATGSLVATIDADTEVRASTLSRCIRRLGETGEAAVACHILTARPLTLLEEIQDVEYRAAFNIERAAQGRLRAISVLPGAATVFRGDVVRDHPFSGRTRTEDADHTLSLASLGHRVGYVRNAVAVTQVPASCSTLAQQRVRWIGGHLQCSVYHAASLLRDRRFTLLTFPLFVILNVAGIAALVSGASLGVTAWLGPAGFDPLQLVLLSAGLVYFQRVAVLWALDEPFPRLRVFLLEPVFMPLVQAYAFVHVLCAGAVSSVRLRVHRSPAPAFARGTTAVPKAGDACQNFDAAAAVFPEKTR